MKDSIKYKVEDKKVIGDYVEVVTKKNKNHEVTLVLTNSAEHGIMSQKDFFDDAKITTNENIDKYTILEKGNFVYNPRKSKHAPYGPVSLNDYDTGVISPLYLCFKIKDDMKSSINSNYIEHYFKSSAWYKHIYMNGDTGTRHDRVSISNSEFFKIPIKAQSFENQEKISKLLSSMDQLIELRKKLVEELAKEQNATYQLMLENSSKWEEKQVKDLFTITRGNVLSKEKNDLSVGKYPVFSSQTTNNGLMGYYKDYLFENAITWTTDGANAGDVKFREGKFYCTNVCGVLKDSNYANYFTAFHLNKITHLYVSYVGNPKLMNNTMGDISLSLPPISKSIDFSKLLDSQNNKIILLQNLIELNIYEKRHYLKKIFG